MKRSILLFLFCIGGLHGESLEEHSRNKDRQASLEHFSKKVALQGNETLLDVGCGDGALSAEIAARLPLGSVVGIDKSSVMITFAQSKYDETLHNLRFQTEDIIGFGQSEKFDIVTSFAAMHWIQDQKSALKEICQSLKKKGKLWIQVPLGIPKALAESLQKQMGEEKWRSYFVGFSPCWKFCSPEEYRGFLEDLRLEVIHIQVYDQEALFFTKERFEAYLRNWLPHLRMIPLERKEEFVQELSRLYEEISPNTSEGHVKFPLKKLEIAASKP